MGTIDDLDAWRGSAVGQWKDVRIVPGEFVDIWIWFWHHLYADLALHELSFRGVSFKAVDDQWLMVLRVQQGEVLQVVFVTSRTPTRCVWRLRGQLRDGSLKLFDDRYK